MPVTNYLPLYSIITSFTVYRKRIKSDSISIPFTTLSKEILLLPPHHIIEYFTNTLSPYPPSFDQILQRLT